MLFKLVSLIGLAALAVATPQRAQPPVDVRTPHRARPPIDIRNVLIAKDARNCTFTAHISERCAFRPTTTKVSYANVSNLLTPSMSAVPVPIDEQPISLDALHIPVTSQNELIDGDLTIDRLIGGDGKVHFSWNWFNPIAYEREIVNWTEIDDGAKTRYGCRVDQPWSKGGITCDKVGPVEQRDLRLSCFFKCRN